MYAGTRFEVIDKSHIPPLPIAQTSYKPLYYCSAPTQKGREDIQVYEGKAFYNNFGNDISFIKYGQPLLQTARIINAGGRVMFKRIVAKDAILANNTVVARVHQEYSQKTNAAGTPLYKDATTGKETITADGNEPIMITKAKIKFELVSYAPNGRTINQTINTTTKTVSVTDAETGAVTVYNVDDQNRAIDPSTGVENADVTEKIANGELTVNETTTTTTQTVADPTIQDYTAFDIDTIAEKAYGEYSTFLEPDKDFESDEGVLYPLFTLTDIGRGVSAKRWNIIPDYRTSKAKKILQYSFQIIENDKLSEKFSFALDPDTVDPFNGNHIDLRTQIDGKSDQVRIKYFPDAIDALYADLCSIMKDQEGRSVYKPDEATVITDADGNVIFRSDPLTTEDILFGYTKKKEYIPYLAYDELSEDLALQYGLTIDNGSNGIFGDNPQNAEAADELHEQYLNAYIGDVDHNSEIYDLNTYQIDIIPDANYPLDVKLAIQDLVNFREDCVAMIDMGTDLTTLDEILLNANVIVPQDYRTRYTYLTFLAYDIIDPYTNRQITVTAMYDLVAKAVPHFANGRSRAFAGIKYDIILESAIRGTENFTPKIVPGVNQNEILDDARINYASWLSGRLVMETGYSTNDEYTQLSYINNVFNLQDLIKAIRVRCPIIRYTFMDKEGLKEYQEDVMAIIDKYADKYMSIDFHYIEDKVMEQNHIYYAAIEVRFKNFIQSEWFRITALPSDL